MPVPCRPLRCSVSIPRPYFLLPVLPRFRLARLVTCLLALVLLGVPSGLLGWGYWAHPRINRAAVLALPPELRGFFYDHVDYLTEAAIVPDLRKHVIGDKAEGPRHYCDVEQFGKPLSEFARTPEAAKVAYDAVTLDKQGRLPWHIQEVFAKLTQAMKDRRKSEILLLAADLGHYLGDAHMPLHTSENHDGQLTDQKGIHALWEARLPEMFGAAYHFQAPPAAVLADPVAEVWRIIGESHAAKDTLLAVDKRIRAETGADNIFEKDAQGAVKKNRYGQPYFTKDYATRLHTALHGMVERRLRASITATANFWFTAWVNAGRPDLGSLDSDALRQASQPDLTTELRLLEQGKLVDLSSGSEF